MYLGQKGYTIPKTLLSTVEERELKQALKFSPKNSFNPAQVKPFYAYRESTKKLYVPRFFGTARYGPVESQLKATAIDVQWTGALRANQEPAVAAFMEHKCGLLELPCGFGKTILSLYILSRLQVKTLIIVHKDFLLQQWVERIQEFLPNATVGRIQGATVDIDKDIVIGMLQSLSMKEYDAAIFRSFGFTIVDETHHIAAEVFSNALFKIVTPYMLGLSATMDRADGLTDVFKQFLGPVLYKAKRDAVDNVVVQCVRYVSDDEEFNETILNYKGQANYTLMIKKICAHAPRTQFLLAVLARLLETESNAQVMILSQNRSLLDDLHAGIAVPCGYYVGGMKTAALKETETKRVILATYAMAEEALDIKTLTTLLMATPKANVTQAVGRILRTPHEAPLVVDVVDPHDTFGRQWKKRKTFYVENKYQIVTLRSDAY
jgi:superfamily II DNA or RNA helicase